MRTSKQPLPWIGRLQRKCIFKFMVILFIVSCIGSTVTVLYHPRKSVIRHTIISEEKPGRFVIFDLGKYNFEAKDDFIVDNCIVTTNENLWNTSDAVAVTLRKVLLSDSDKFFKLRRKKQIWVMIFDESAYHYQYGMRVRPQHLKHAFHWSMTNERRSDVFIPYGYTERLAEPRNIPDFVQNRRRGVSAIVSNCHARNKRLDIIRALNTTIPVDLYGQCAKRECEGYLAKLKTNKDACPELKHYMFHLAFENSNCHDYITEKPFLHGLSLGAVPVVMGARKEDYQKLLPPGSFIYAGDFNDTVALGKYLKYLIENNEKYKEYHVWRKLYKVHHRKQYFDNAIWKPLCDKLNNNSQDIPSKTIKDPVSWLDINHKCTTRVQINIRNNINITN